MGIEGNRLLAGMQMHLRAIVGKPFRWKHVCVTHVVPFSASFFFFFVSSQLQLKFFWRPTYGIPWQKFTRRLAIPFFLILSNHLSKSESRSKLFVVQFFFLHGKVSENIFIISNRRNNSSRSGKILEQKRAKQKPF